MNGIFVSSSFMDFQSERDIIRSIVLPEINDYLRRYYAQETNIIDLRWGIDTSVDKDEHISMGKILQTCLLEIQNCQPFMVVLLGDRYGTKATSEQVHSNMKMTDAVDIPEDGIGVTELEIRYAMYLAQKHQMDIHFYFRDMDYHSVPDDKMDLFFDQVDADSKQQRLNNLKEEIKAQYTEHCRSYTAYWNPNKKCVDGLTEFSSIMIADLKECIAAELGAPHHEKRNVDKAFMRSNQKFFVGRQQEIERIKLFLDNTERQVCLVNGTSGAGKSALLSNIPRLIDNAQYDCVPVFCGQDYKSDTALDVISRIIDGICELTGTTKLLHKQSPLTPGQQHRAMDNAVEMYLARSKKTLVLLIDGIDQLIEDILSKKMFFLPMANRRVKIILSAPNDYNIDYTLPALVNLEEVYLEEPSNNDISQILNNIWQKHGKHSVSKEIEECLACKPLSKNYLYLNLLVNRLTLMGKEVFASEKNNAQYINETIIQTINQFPETLEGAAAEFLAVLGKTINPALANAVFSYLRISHNGMRTLDLQSLCEGEWNGLDFSLIKKLLGSFIFERADHRIDFTHKVFRCTGHETAAGNMQEYRQKYFNYALTLPLADSQSVSYSVHSAICAGNFEVFYRKISEWEVKAESLQIAAAELAVLLEEDDGKIRAGLAEHFPVETLDIGVTNFFAEYLVPLLPADSAAIGLLEAISKQLHQAGIDHLSTDQLTKLCDFEYAKNSLKKEYSDEPGFEMWWLEQYLAELVGNTPNSTNKYRYIEVVLKNPLTENTEINNCILMIKDDRSAEATALKAIAEIILAGNKYPKAIIRRDEIAERHIDVALSLIDELAGKALCMKTTTDMQKYMQKIAAAYKLIGDIYLRVDGVDAAWVGLGEKMAFYKDAEAFYKSSIKAYRSCIKVLDTSGMEGLFGAISGLLTVCTHGTTNVKTQKQLFDDIQNVLAEAEKQINITLQSQPLCMLYANLCGAMSDAFGIIYPEPIPFDTICSKEDGLQMVKDITLLHRWGTKQVSMYQHIVRCNPNPKYARIFLQGIINRIKSLNWYGYKSERTIDLQFNRSYGLDFQSISKHFRHEERFEEDCQAVQRMIQNPDMFDPYDFVEKLKEYRQSLYNDEHVLMSKKINLFLDFYQALEIYTHVDPDYSHAVSLYLGQRIMSRFTAEYSEMDIAQIYHIEELILCSIRFAISNPHSLSWFVLCQHPKVEEWGFNLNNDMEPLYVLSEQIEKLRTQFPAFSHPDSCRIYELETLF